MKFKDAYTIAEKKIGEPIGLGIQQRKNKKGIFISKLEDGSKIAAAENIVKPNMRLVSLNGVACPTTVPETLKLIRNTSGKLTITVEGRERNPQNDIRFRRRRLSITGKNRQHQRRRHQQEEAVKKTLDQSEKILRETTLPAIVEEEKTSEAGPNSGTPATPSSEGAVYLKIKEQRESAIPVTTQSKFEEEKVEMDHDEEQLLRMMCTIGTISEEEARQRRKKGELAPKAGMIFSIRNSGQNICY